MLFISIGDLDDQSTVKFKHSPNPRKEIELRQRRPNVGISSMGSKKRSKKKKKMDISELLLFVFILYYNIVEEETGVSNNKITEKNVEEDNNNVIGKLSMTA